MNWVIFSVGMVVGLLFVSNAQISSLREDVQIARHQARSAKDALEEHERRAKQAERILAGPVEPLPPGHYMFNVQGCNNNGCSDSVPYDIYIQ